MSRPLQGWDAAGREVWRESTPAEDANIASLVTKANNALSANATFLAIASPTTAQVATQVKALTRQIDALIRLHLAAVSDISDT